MVGAMLRLEEYGRMALILGAAILRRSASILLVQQTGRAASILFERRLDRAPGSTPAEMLRALLTMAPAPVREELLVIALSPADLACSDGWTLPEAMPDRVGPSLCEPRCASETLETLIVDAPISGRAVQAVALDLQRTNALLDAAGARTLAVVTAVPAALATFGTVSLTQGGERIEVHGSSWRAYPVDGPDEPGTQKWRDLEIPNTQAAAFAAAVCDPDAVPNLLHAIPKHRKTWVHRLRDPLVNVGVAAVLCLAALGVRFHRDAILERNETAAARRVEKELWQRYLPAEEPREGHLLKAMQDRLADLGEGGSGPEFPSALAFWGEIGRQMSDPDALGLTLESLDLAPDGGRIAARVPAVKEDPLRNASQLEGKLNESRKMSARGDYEVRDGQVQVRLRMDYRP
jgi:hypothetical protein